MLRFCKRVTLLAMTLAIGLYAVLALSLVALKWVNPITTGVQAQRRIEALSAGKSYQKKRTFTPLNRISPALQHAVIAAEDGRFFTHRGVDWVEVQRVLDEDREPGDAPRGASTITQQLVKNLFFTTHRSWLRKGVEMTLAPAADLILGKRRTLELYLNVVEWGPGVFGAEAAARAWYGVSAASLTRDQAARLAAILPAPRRRKPARMNRYSADIERRMSQMGW
jgi:monofunctional biosynthetic peptidoglycan transglycosylase